MAFDPTISTGNLITIAAVALNFVYSAIKGSFVAGREKEHLTNIEGQNQREFLAINKKLDAQDVAIVDKSRELEATHQRAFAEINKKLDAQDLAAKEKSKADVMADGILLLMQHRVTTLEQELLRCRENIHRIANHLQVEIARMVRAEQQKGEET